MNKKGSSSATEQPSTPRRPKTPEYRPWHPEEYELHIAAAAAALARGDCDPAQQQAFMNWLIRNLCRTYDVDFFPESDRDTSFAAGKRHVGLQVVKMVNLNTAKLTGKPSEQG